MPACAGASNSRCQTCPQDLQVRRPERRFTTSSKSTSRSSTTDSGAPSSSSIWSSSPAWATLRGNPSSRKPSFASGCASRSRTIALVTSSGTRSPASMYFLAIRPSSVPPDTLARKMSPVEIFGMVKFSAMNSAWVPLPAPGGPTSTSLMRLPSLSASAQESFVVPLHQLALDLLHGVEAHADHDQHCGATEREVLIVAAGDTEEEVRQDGDDSQVHRTGQRDPGEHELQILGRGASGPDAGDEAAVLLHVVGALDRVERDADVEV